MTRLLRNYARAYADCYRWLYRVCPPWRWVLSAYCVPGSPAMNAAKEAAAASWLGGWAAT